MNEFIAGPGQTLQQAVPANGQSHPEESAGEPPKEDATMKAADAFVNIASAGKHLFWDDKQKGGPIVHYAFGALMGGFYGGLSEYSSTAKSGPGTSFGSALFAGADLLAVPTLQLAPAPTEQPGSALVSPIAAHLVYGATTELVRRAVRAVH